MYFTQIAEYTRDHLYDHLSELISKVNVLNSDTLLVTPPVTIDISSMVGGVMKLARDTLPQYAVDCTVKNELDSADMDLYLYGYTGQFQFLVSGETPEIAEELARRHAWMLEYFCRTHLLLHNYAFTTIKGFKIVDFNCSNVELLGSMNLNQEGGLKEPLWVSGGTLDLFWTTSEWGYFQHTEDNLD